MGILKGVMKLVVSILTIGYLVYFIYTNWIEIPTLYNRVVGLDEKAIALLILLACNISSWLIVSVQFLVPLRQIGVKIGFLENAALFIAGVLLNYSPHKAGVLYRLHYLKKWYQVPYTSFIGLQIVRIVATFGVAGLIGLLALAFRYIVDGVYSFEMSVLVFLMFAAGVLPFFIPIKLLHKSNNMITNIIKNLYEGIRGLRRDRLFAFLFVLLIALQFVVLFVQYYVIFRLTDYHPTFITYLLLVPLIIMLSMISITPGNLGLREVITASALSLTSGDFDTGMMVSILDRGVLFSSTLIFGIVSLLFLTAKRNIFKNK